MQNYSENIFKNTVKFILVRETELHLLLFLDGHKSHISLDLLEWAKERKIILFILPAHTSHILQPLDVSCYGLLHKMYNSECSQNTTQLTLSWQTLLN